MTPGRLPAAFLVVAILVCHGLFGAAHQTFTPATGTHGHHAPAVDHGGNYGDPQTGYHEAGHLAGSAEYAAVLVSVFIGTALELMLRVVHPRSVAAGIHPGRQGFRVASAILHPPRGPTLPALQVFRL